MGHTHDEPSFAASPNTTHIRRAAPISGGEVTFVVGRNIKSGRGGEENENAGFPRSERGFSGVKPRREKFHKKTIFCGLASIDNNILL